MRTDGVGRYTRVAVILHWWIGAMIVLNLAGGLLADSLGDLKGVAMGAHKTAGIVILLLSFARIVWRVTHRPPALPHAVAGWEAGLAKASHALFYVLMIAMPILGWIMSSAAARSIDMLLFDWPLLPIAGNRAAGGLANELHEIGGYVMIALLVLHVAGALKHQIGDKLPVLRRMGLKEAPARASIAPTV